jgi:4-amino-4-deoxy-L-arabinose transferase-like glycosyltransferase
MALAGVALGARIKSYSIAALTGVLFGAATLTRETGIPVAVASVCWWLLMAERRDRWSAARRGVVVLVCAAAVVLPWTWRNYKVLDRFVPVSNIGWFAAAVGNIPGGWLSRDGEGVRSFISEYRRFSETDRSDFARERAFANIRSDQPVWILKKIVRVPSRLLAPHSFIKRKIRTGAYGEVALSTVTLVLVATGVSYILIYIAGVLGVASAGDGRGALGCLVFGVVIAAHILVNATSRYRVPFMPFLMVYASFAFLNGRHLLSKMSYRSRLCAALVIIHFLFLCVLPVYWR